MPWLALMYIYFLFVLLLQQLFELLHLFPLLIHVRLHFTPDYLKLKWNLPYTSREGICRCGSITLLILELRQGWNWEPSFTLPSIVLWILAKWAPELFWALRIKGTPVFLCEKCNRASSDVHLAALPVYRQRYPTFQLSPELRYYVRYSWDKSHHFPPNFSDIFDWNRNIIP
jgi:hypothetical protein